MSAPHLEIDLDAIRDNVRAVRAFVGTPILAVVKANAYGHGAVPVARAALDAGAMRLGVVDLAEALALREAGITAPILAWMHSPSTEWELAFAHDIELGVSSVEQLLLVQRAAERVGAVARLHLKVDTGLGRNGALEREWGSLCSAMRDGVAAGSLEFVGLFSHLAGAGPEADAAQLAAFRRAEAVAASRGVTPRLRHLCASAGSIALGAGRLDLVRLGIAMYGLTPFGPTDAVGVAVRPALRLFAPLQYDDEGAFVQLGLADGLPAANPEQLRGIRLVDERGGTWRLLELGTIESRVEPLGGAGADASTLTIIGAGGDDASSADEWAAAVGTIGYEVVTRLAPGLERRFLGDTASANPAGSPVRSRPVRSGRTAPRRRLVVDLEQLAANAAAAAEAGLLEVDCSADAYGHGLDLVLPVLLEAGLRPIVRHEREAELVRAAGSREVRIVPHPGEKTREVYGVASGGLIRLESELVHVKRVARGQGVSYGHDWVAPSATTLGLVPLGYGDGVPRRIAGQAWFGVPGAGAFDDEQDGPAAPYIVGRVAMDQVVVDLGDLETWTGSTVVLIGRAPGEPSLTQAAQWCGAEPLAVLGAVGPRVDRVAWSVS